MPRVVSPESVRAAAAIVDVQIEEHELQEVADRLAIMFDAYDQFAHLTESTAELDLHFDARWETESA